MSTKRSMTGLMGARSGIPPVKVPRIVGAMPKASLTSPLAASDRPKPALIRPE
jgi:hypothetical protein